MILNCPDKVLGVRSDSFLLVGLIQHYFGTLAVVECEAYFQLVVLETENT
jgi:hypothetical protein